MVFSTLLLAGSVADTWWNKLDNSKKTAWTDVKTVFIEHWPAITVAEKTVLDYQCEILALCLTDKNIGMQIIIAVVAIWAHLQFHNNLQQLVSKAGAATMTGLVYQVRENLPVVMKELTTPGVVDWKKFLEEIKDIDTNKLQEKAEGVRKKKEVEKAHNARLTRLESLQTDAVETMHLQLQRTNIQPGQATSNTAPPTLSQQTSRIWYTPRGSAQNTRPSFHPRQPLTTEEHDLMRSRTEELTHHTDTANGRTAYEEQTKQWFARHSLEGRVTENTPFPLWPGSAMICSGECFRCGTHWHMAADCRVPEALQLII